MPGRQECYLCDDSALVSGLPDVGNRRVFCVREVRRTVTGIGTRVGKLTVAADSGQRKSGYIVWRCRCDCGGEILLDTRCLQRGKVTDCGCTTNVNSRQRDITGMRFGKLTAICPTQGRGRRGGARSADIRVSQELRLSFASCAKGSCGQEIRQADSHRICGKRERDASVEV